MTIAGDRFNYNDAAARSANEQLLLNLVRLRYGEPTYWLEISSMLSQYELQVGGALTQFDYTLMPLRRRSLRAANGLDPDPVVSRQQEANLEYIDRPTITYVPLQGRDFANRLLTPIPPETLLALAESGWPIDRLLDCCVQRINDVSNTPIHDVAVNPSFDPGPFNRASALFRAIQDCGDLHFSVSHDASDNAARLDPPSSSSPAHAEVQELGGLLRVDLARQRIQLAARAAPPPPNTLTLQTRSLLATMFALSESFTPPADHVTAGETLPGAPAELNAAAKWLDIQTSRLPATDAYVQVFHHGYWFRIESRDYRSKRTFALLIYLLSLQTANVGGAAPVLSLPTGG